MKQWNISSFHPKIYSECKAIKFYDGMQRKRKEKAWEAITRRKTHALHIPSRWSFCWTFNPHLDQSALISNHYHKTSAVRAVWNFSKFQETSCIHTHSQANTRRHIQHFKICTLCQYFEWRRCGVASLVGIIFVCQKLVSLPFWKGKRMHSHSQSVQVSRDRVECRYLVKISGVAQVGLYDPRRKSETSWAKAVCFSQR